MAIEYLRRPEPNSPTPQPKSAAWNRSDMRASCGRLAPIEGIKALALGGVGRRAKILYRE